jgi:hypothetical protein
VESGRAGRNDYGFKAAEIRRELLFECLAFRAVDEVTAPQNLFYSCDFLVADTGYG